MKKSPSSRLNSCLILLFSIAICAFADSSPAQTDTVNRADRWNNTATNGNTGALGTPVTITWSIARDGQNFASNPPTPSNLVNFLDTQWNTSGSATSFNNRSWFEPLKQGFERWGEISGLSYAYEPNDSGNFGASGVLGVRGDVRVGGYDLGGPGGTIAKNFFPDGGDMVLDTTETTLLDPGSDSNRRFRNVISHEHGHGLGLDHIIDDVAGGTFLMNPSLSVAFDGPQFHDILAVQRGYGDALEKNGGNDTRANATSLGAISIGSSAGKGFDTPDFGGSPTGITMQQTDFISIDDDSDTDFFKFSVDGRSNTTIALNPRGPSYGAVIQDDPQGATTEFNASTRSDLVLTIFDQTGVQLAQYDANGAGSNETASQFRLAEAGDYFARVTGKDNEAQMYSVNVSVNNTPAVANPNVIFRDTFQFSSNTNNINSGRNNLVRQGDSVVDAQLIAGSNDSEDTSVSLIDNKLTISTTSDASGANQAYVDLNRNFFPQVSGEVWEFTFDVAIAADLGIINEWFGFTFGDESQIGLPFFSDDAEMAILLRSDGEFIARENGGQDSGEFNLSGNVSPLDGLYNYAFLVDETGPEALMSLSINDMLLFSDEIFDFSNSGRYFSFRSNVGNANTVGTNFTASLDNFQLRLVAVPEPVTLVPWVLIAAAAMRRRRS